MKRLLIKTRHIIAMDAVLGDLPDGEILLDSATIAAVRNDLEVGDVEVLDAGDLVAPPGRLPRVFRCASRNRDFAPIVSHDHLRGCLIGC